MGHLSLPILAGIPCLEFFGAASAFPLVSDLASASSEDLAGAGATGAMTGTAVDHSSTITTGSRIVGTSVTGASITVISATVTLDTAASTMAADSTGLPVFTEARAFTEAPTFTHREAGTRAGSAALITAGTHEAFLRAVIRALAAAASTAVADMAVAVTTK